jgi:hypothetical protein
LSGAAERLAATAMPDRIAALKRDHRGYPIPAFVEWIDGAPDFRVMSPRHFERCLKVDACWICGQKLGRFKVFAAGPMCTVTRTSAEPPSHLDCCEYSVRVCPFMAIPRMRRIDAGLPEDITIHGVMIERNPGVTALWCAHSYEPFRARASDNVPLIEMGEPEWVRWYCEGRAATRAEVDAAITSGLPILQDAARRDARPAVALADLETMIIRQRPWLPA